LDEEELDHQRKLRRITREIEFHKEDTNLQNQREQVEQNRYRQIVRFYNELVQNGSGQLVFLHLAQHPDEVKGIVQQLSQLEKEDQNHWLDALMKLKDSDILEEHHVKEVRDFILQQLKNRQKQEQFLEEMLSRSNGQSTS